MRALTTNLWVDEQPHRLFGVELGARMTLVRLPDGGLWAHSPIALTARRRAAVEALGPMAHLIAPNRLHHVYLPAWAEAFPEARVWAPPGLEAKQPRLRIDHRHGEAPPWAEILEPLAIDGNPTLGETVFLHRPSRTVVSADLAINVHEGPRWTRVFLGVNGAFGKPGISRFVRGTFTDRPATVAAVRAILAWNPERLIISHGRIIEGAAAVEAALLQTYAFCGIDR